MNDFEDFKKKYPRAFTKITLTPEAFDNFMKVIENPPPPSPELIKMMRTYGRFINKKED